MNHQIRSVTACAALLASGAFCLGSGAPASAQQPATVTRTFETTATIESVDQNTRQVLLRRQDGTFATMVAGPDVRNLAQVKAGDRVFARYESALVARIGRPEQQMLSDRTLEDGAAAEPGEKPFSAYDLDVRRKLKVTAIDTDSNTVSFLDGDSRPRTVRVRSPQMQAFLRTLKVGDDVDVAYREASMIAVEPAR